VRVAALILGLILSFALFIQSLLISAGESIDDALNDRQAEAENGSVGVLVALLMLVASALVIAKPRFSMWAFTVSALIAVLGAATGDFVDLWFWAVVAAILAVLSWRGSIEKRKKDAEERAGREAIQQLARQNLAAAPPSATEPPQAADS
jgi:hypothetical protein